MVLKEIIAKMREKKERFKEMKDEDQMQETLATRKKNSNERELDRFMEEERQKEIKIQLETFRMRRKDEARKENMLKGKNIFAGHKSILTDNKKLFSTRNNIHKGGMFFK